MRTRFRRSRYGDCISNVQPYQLKLLRRICYNNSQYDFNQLLNKTWCATFYETIRLSADFK